MGKLRNLLNNRYGRLTVVSLITDKVIKNQKKSTARNAAWKCRCDCGGERIVAACCLLKGNTRSCGCLEKENKSKMGRLRGGYNKTPDAAMRAVYRSYKLSATQKKRDFELSEEDFKTKTQLPCYYCGGLPSCHYRASTYKSYVYNGIDRVDNNKGYTIDNCVPCCKVCNVAKANLSEEDFADWVCKVFNFWAKYR